MTGYQTFSFFVPLDGQTDSPAPKLTLIVRPMLFLRVGLLKQSNILGFDYKITHLSFKLRFKIFEYVNNVANLFSEK